MLTVACFDFFANIIPSRCFGVSVAIFGLIFLILSFCLSSVLAQADVMLRRIPVSASIPDSLIEIKMINERTVKTVTKLIIVKFSLYQSILSMFSISIIRLLSAY